MCALAVLLGGCAARGAVVPKPQDILKGKPRLEVAWPESGIGQQNIEVLVAGSLERFPAVTAIFVQAGNGWTLYYPNLFAQRLYDFTFRNENSDSILLIRVAIVSIDAFDLRGRPARLTTLTEARKSIPLIILAEAAPATGFQIRPPKHASK